MVHLKREDFGSYIISFYSESQDNLLIVFTSAGQHGLGEPVEEFRSSLSHYGASVIFIIEREPHWYNQPDALVVFSQVAEWAKPFRHVGVLGESMGGSGSILFTNYLPKIDRVLSLGPQYSVAEPFIRFDSRFLWFGQARPDQMHWTFGPSPIRDRVQILFGNAEFEDTVHAAMFIAEGFPVTFVEGAGHRVAQYLKKGTSENRLRALLDAFTDFTVPFTREALARALGPLCSQTLMSDGNYFAERSRWSQRYLAALMAPRRLPPPADLADLTLGRPTTQSSVLEIMGESPEVNSAGAVSGRLMAGCAFHTDLEDQPWWRVDFEAPAEIHEVRLYNRLENVEVASRGVHFAIETSGDLERWEEIHRKTDDLVFGGADGAPYVAKIDGRVTTRYLRIRLLDKNFLHYAAVEVFGRFL